MPGIINSARACLCNLLLVPVFLIAGVLCACVELLVGAFVVFPISLVRAGPRAAIRELLNAFGTAAWVFAHLFAEATVKFSRVFEFFSPKGRTIATWTLVAIAGVVLYYRTLPQIEIPSFLAVLMALIVLSSFFSASETAWTKLDSPEGRARLDAWLANPWPGKDYRSLTHLVTFQGMGSEAVLSAVNEIRKNSFQKTLYVLLVGNNVVNIAGGFALSAAVIVEDKELFMVFATVLPILLFGELAAKGFAERWPVRVAVYLSVFVLPATRIVGFLSEGLASPVDGLFEKHVGREPSYVDRQKPRPSKTLIP